MEGPDDAGPPQFDEAQALRLCGNDRFDLTDALTLKSITAYRNLDTAITSTSTRPAMRSATSSSASTRSSSARNSSSPMTSGRGLTAVGGLYYLREDVGSHQEAYADDLLGRCFTAFLRYIDDDLMTQSYAAYVNVSYTGRAACGFRPVFATRTRSKDYDRTTTALSTFVRLNSTVRVRTERQLERPVADGQLRSTGRSTPDDDALRRVAKGFKSGGFNGRANAAEAATEYDPETVWSFEARL